MSFDVITMGRISVDVYPQQTGVSLRHVTSFGKYLGGSSTNVAVAAARYGHAVATITRTGADPFGEYLHDALQGFDVDDRWVTPVDGLPTPLAFCEIFPPDDFPLYFYRYPKAPDLEINPEELDLGAIKDAKLFWATVTGLSQEPSRSATLAALEARGDGGLTVLDLDYRSMFWESREAAREQVARALEHVNVAVGNLDEWETAVGTRDPREAASTSGLDLAVVKQGPKGVLARRGDTWAEVPPVPVEVVNGLGAGDAFGGALCHGLLAGWELERVMRFANAAGALVASRLACADAMPTEEEVEELMGAHMSLEYTRLRVVELDGGSEAFDTQGDELIVLPLNGSATVTIDGERFELTGRPSVFEGITDFAYAPRDAHVEIAGSGRFALPAASARQRLAPRYGPAEQVPVELRGAGSASRQVNNFCSPEAFPADALIAVEVLTPNGNWSSYPPHKHDEDVPGVEVALEEIYYFEVSGDDGFAYQRVYGSGMDVLREIRSGDRIDMPRGYHGPSMAAPGYDLYYLNVMAGPGERAWRFTDDPAHAWIRDTWAEQTIDPRLPMTGVNT